MKKPLNFLNPNTGGGTLTQWIKQKSLVYKIVIGLLLAVLLVPLTYKPIVAGAIPTTSIVDVVKDTSVTIRTYDFPAEETFTVTMGKFGTRGIAGYIVNTFGSGSGGSFEKTFTIPAALLDEDKIAIRLESPHGYYAFDWFYNNDNNQPIVEEPTPINGYVGIPTTTIKSVEAGVSVTLVTHNFPPDQIFSVTMGEFGSRGIGGTKVADTDSGAGGSFEVTYTIPEGLADNHLIAIRLQSPEGYYAYDWFVNQPGSSEETIPGYTGIPTTSILNVVPGESVTLRTYNFPPDQTFAVTMGEFGTRGIGGIKVADTDSGDGGSFDVTYDIPEELAENHLIAIRLDNGSGYFAYDWFVNQPTTYETIPGYTGIPTTSIKSVTPGVSVTITTHNFPPDTNFDITMGAFGTKGVGGTYIKTINSGEGGSFEVVCDIPAGLVDYDLIAIRFQSSGPYYAYDWFSNK
ncbi:MAG: hypothetical protein HPY85_04390 [Anaerolineae bacterium]|nr:hypothetical protein [Anaerolineae bacterium]